MENFAYYTPTRLIFGKGLAIITPRWMRHILNDHTLERFVKFSVDGLLRGDYATRMSGYATARQNGWMSANDIRELENLDRIPAEEGGDLYLINGNMCKLADAGIFSGQITTSQSIDDKEEPPIE